MFLCVFFNVAMHVRYARAHARDGVSDPIAGMDTATVPHCRRLRMLSAALGGMQPAAVNRRLLRGPAEPGEGYATMDLSGRVVSE